MTLVILFAVAAVAGATNNRITNSSFTMCYENTTVQEVQEIACNNAPNESTMLEEWINGRENWEQEGQEMERIEWGLCLNR